MVNDLLRAWLPRQQSKNFSSNFIFALDPNRLHRDYYRFAAVPLYGVGSWRPVRTGRAISSSRSWPARSLCITATTTSERVSFRQINKKTGNRLRQQLVDDVTREVVETADKGRVATRSTRASTSRSTTRSWRRSRSRAATPSTSTASCRAAADRRALSGQHLLNRAQRPGRPRSLRRDPAKRCAAQGRGGTRPHRAGEARACHRAAALGQGRARHHAALLLRGSAIAGEYFDEIPDVKIGKEMLQLAEHILETKAGRFPIRPPSLITTRKRWSTCSSTRRPALR